LSAWLPGSISDGFQFPFVASFPFSGQLHLEPFQKQSQAFESVTFSPDLEAARESATMRSFTRVSRNADLPIRSNREPFSNVTDSSDLHRQKLPFPKPTTDEGISIDLKPLSLNANSSIRSNREPFSNVTDSSDLHPEKLLLSKATTDEGITIDFNPLSRNAYSSIRSNREPLSNVTDSSDLHPEKLLSSKATTDEGITIDLNPLS
jgi:hypothetical protein